MQADRRNEIGARSIVIHVEFSCCSTQPRLMITSHRSYS